MYGDVVFLELGEWEWPKRRRPTHFLSKTDIPSMV